MQLYYDNGRGQLMPNTLKMFKERHAEFLTALQLADDEFRCTSDPKKWWARSVAKAKADSILKHLDQVLMSMEVYEKYFARYTAMKACVLYEASEFLMDKSVGDAIHVLKKAHQLLYPLLPISEVYFLYFCTIVNYVELSLSVNSPLDPLIQMLEEAIQIHELGGQPKVLFTCNKLFSSFHKINPSKEAEQLLEQNITRIYQLLVTLYICNMDTEKYVKCEHFLLKRELKQNKYNIYDWINRTTILSKILITENDFRNARHHLAMASVQYNKHLAKTMPNVNEEKMKLRKTEETLATGWIKYGLKLLTQSKNAMLAKYSQGDVPITVINSSDENRKNKLEVLIERTISEHSTQILHEINEKSNYSLQVAGEDKDSEEINSEFVGNKDGSSLIDKALLLEPQDTIANKLSDALRKYSYVDLRFPGQEVDNFEKRIPRSIIDSPKEAADVLIFLLPWIDLLRKLIRISAKPVKFAESVLELNDLFKMLVFFQPNPEQQYELHKERQVELELLAWLLKKEEDPTMVDTEIIVARELSIAHYQLTEMNLKRVKQLERETASLRSKSL